VLARSAQDDAKESTSIYQPPEGGLVLYVTWKVLADHGRTGSSSATQLNRHEKLLRDSLGVDRLWVRKDEAELLARGTFPESLRARMLPHLSDAFTGTVETLEILSQEGHLAGRLRSDTGDEGSLRGRLAAKDGRVTHLILVARGWGERVSSHGFAAGLEVVPAGRKVPVAVLFTLADPADDLSKVPPKRCKDDGYLR
jgi:hypothetical protein